jgi:hypothetical protein
LLLDTRHDVAVPDEPTKGAAQASLRVFSDTVTFEWITEQLDIQADIGANAGDPGPGRSTRRSTLCSRAASARSMASMSTSVSC